MAGEDFCYLITRGRRTGQPHTIEIWFAVDASGAHPGAIYMMAGGRHQADWVRNLVATPDVQVRFGRRDAPVRDGIAHPVDPDRDPEADAAARRLLAEKYDEWEDGGEGRVLSNWARTALPVIVRLQEREG